MPSIAYKLVSFILLMTTLLVLLTIPIQGMPYISMYGAPRMPYPQHYIAAITIPIHYPMYTIGGGYGSPGSYGLVPITYNMRPPMQQQHYYGGGGGGGGGGGKMYGKQIRPLTPYEQELLNYYDNEDE